MFCHNTAVVTHFAYVLYYTADVWLANYLYGPIPAWWSLWICQVEYMLKYLASIWCDTEVKDGSECVCVCVCVCGRFGKAAKIFVCVCICACCGSMISKLWGVQKIIQSLKLYLIIKKKKLNFVSTLYAFINTLKYRQCWGLVELVAVRSLWDHTYIHA